MAKTYSYRSGRDFVRRAKAAARDERTVQLMGASGSIWGPNAPYVPSLRARKRRARQALLGNINHTIKQESK